MSARRDRRPAPRDPRPAPRNSRPTGHRLSSDEASSLILGPESFDSVGSIVVSHTGEVAWIDSASSLGTHLRGVQVVAHENGGRRVLDSGRTIAAGSLRLHGSRLTWRRGGAVQAAQLG